MTGTKRKSELEADSSLTPVNDQKSECSVVTRPQSKKSKLSTDSAGSLSVAGPQETRVIDAPVGVQSQVVQKIANKFVKHDAYWLSDGNTLVQIGEVRFKLVRSTLVKQSTWFCTMIENPPNDECIYVDEGTRETVYCLDSLKVNVDDFVTLLNALDDSVSYAYNSPSLKTVAAILRAAHVLEFDRFKTFAVSYLEDKWPGDFAKFNGGIMKHAADAAKLARQYGVNSALKRTFYELVRTDLFDQYTDSDEGNHNEVRTLPAHYTWFVNTREELVEFWMRKAIPPKENTCVSPKESKANNHCAITRSRVHVLYRGMIHNSGIFLRYRHDPMVGLQALIDAPWVVGEGWPSTYTQDLPIVNKVDGHLCVECANRWRAMWNKEKEELWNNLDDWFGLAELIAKP